jgi:hypothetical protein
MCNLYRVLAIIEEAPFHSFLSPSFTRQHKAQPVFVQARLETPECLVLLYNILAETTIKCMHPVSCEDSGARPALTNKILPSIVSDQCSSDAVKSMVLCHSKVYRGRHDRGNTGPIKLAMKRRGEV